MKSIFIPWLAAALVALTSPAAQAAKPSFSCGKGLH